MLTPIERTRRALSRVGRMKRQADELGAQAQFINDPVMRAAMLGRQKQLRARAYRISELIIAWAGMARSVELEAKA